MKKEKVICTFGRHQGEFNKIKRGNEIERAPRPHSGGNQGGKPKKGDVTPPGFTSITITDITATSATVNVITTEETSIVVQYGTTTSYGLSKSGSATKVSSQSVILTGLTASTGYHLRIVATDLAGNVSNSPDYLITTLTTGSASNVIYVEFYGTTIANTMWNVSGPIVAGHSGFTTVEVEDVLARIQAHFADYNVLITNDINVYNNTSIANKQRVVITESNEWYGNNAGGVAYIGSWGWSDQAPAFVFSKLLYYNIHYVAEAAAHEIGHILGLEHQVRCENGVITQAYNSGDGITAPIMGNSYSVPSGDWWVGPKSYGCSYIQDDDAEIQALLGLKS